MPIIDVYSLFIKENPIKIYFHPFSVVKASLLPIFHRYPNITIMIIPLIVSIVISCIIYLSLIFYAEWAAS